MVGYFFCVLQNTPIMLQDGNSALYPLAKDCLEGIRDPLWIDLPPIQAMSIGLQSLYNVAPNCKNKVSIIALALQVSI